MPRFKVRVTQMAEETAELEIEAASETNARAHAQKMMEGGDVDWQDGTWAGDYEVVNVTLAKP